MNAFKFHLSPQISACAAVVGLALTPSVFAQSATAPTTPANAPAAVLANTEVPDGAPQLAPEKVISNTSTGVTGVTNPGRSASSVIVNEERIQGRLATATVSVGGAKGYTVVDPDAGRSDRQPNNGGKRLSPSLWELLRF
ncbi:MAG: hypothetical protein ABIZ64_00085 [Casimicrobium sp.]